VNGACALAHRVVLVEATSGIPLDISLAALPFEERVIARASSYEFSTGQPSRLVPLKISWS
jgi:hypothetical protein